MKIEFCAKKDPKMLTIYDLKPGDVFRFKDIDVDNIYMAMNFRNDMIYINLETGYSGSISSIKPEVLNYVEILEAELKVYE